MKRQKGLRQASISKFFSKDSIEFCSKDEQDSSSKATNNLSDIGDSSDQATRSFLIKPYKFENEIPSSKGHCSQQKEPFQNNDLEKPKVESMDNSLNEPPLKRSRSSVKDVKGLTENTPCGLPYTPLEQQYIELRRKYPDMLLMIEVGYKFRFFGDDARAAANVLHIACFKNRNFLSASIPVHRAHIHTKKLVSAGYKVGVIRQSETAAIKSAGDNKYTPFKRSLGHVFTSATFIDPNDDLALGEDYMRSNTGQFIAAICDSKYKSLSTDEIITISIVAVNPSTGAIFYETFEDRYRKQIYYELQRIQCSEVILSRKISPATAKVVDAYVKSNKCRSSFIEQEFPSASSREHLKLYFKIHDVDQGRSLPILQLHDDIISCIMILIEYLKDFGLEDALSLTEEYHKLHESFHMFLSNRVIEDLNILSSNSSGNIYGSLLWLVDRCRTAFGRRMLVQWISAPSKSREVIESRLDIVQEVLESKHPQLEKLRKIITGLFDLEKALIRVFYKRCKPVETYKFLSTLSRLSHTFALDEECFLKCKFFHEIMKCLPSISTRVEELLNEIDDTQVETGEENNFFKIEFQTEKMRLIRADILKTEEKFEEFLIAQRENLNISMEYVSNAGIEYLVEISNSVKKQIIPPSWVKVNGTKSVSRYHPLEVIQLLKEVSRLRELLDLEFTDMFHGFLGRISKNFALLRLVISLIAELDVYFSMAEISRKPKYTRPRFVSSSGLFFRNARHPIVEELLNEAFVPNDVKLGTVDTRNLNNTRQLLLSGPNMGGKSCYMAQVALVAIMAHTGFFVPADEAILGIIDAVYTRMGARDNIFRKQSTFMMEMDETSEICRFATRRSLVIMDELGRGTSTFDGVAISYAVLHHLISNIQCLLVFVTHFGLQLEGLVNRYPGYIEAHHMGYLERPENKESVLTFLYKLVKGIAPFSFGLNVARLADIPSEILQKAAVKSEDMSADIRCKLLREVIRKILNVDRLKEIDLNMASKLINQ